ncbi:hypothetical protein B0A55_11680 [Friedmanniomyces simplex]|uniref:F-box domain-containing protein n=1 Tax=Friedmanniomyces simplex TaxID=329884 RepID=A0A4U0WHI2_9PEZI|nr:hypothetical protein B0A55_11680 [Friedmanniomyces simplex]
MGGDKRSGEKHQADTSKEAVDSDECHGNTANDTSAAVSHTTGLLENILSFLPMNGLLVAQMVCVRWRNVINQVKQFKQRLFLEPSVPRVAWTWTTKNRYVADLRRLDVVPEPSHATATNDKISIRAALHPLVTFTWTRKKFNILPFATATNFTVRDQANWRHKSGLWRQFFGMQLPAPSVSAQYYVSAGEGQVYNPDYFSFDSDEGVTLGDLVDCRFELEAEGQTVDWVVAGSLRIAELAGPMRRPKRRMS